jgi:hypothetical protein
MLLCKSALVAESLKHLLGTHLNRLVQGVTASTAQAEGVLILCAAFSYAAFRGGRAL